jgi:hypothetical protein
LTASAGKERPDTTDAGAGPVGAVDLFAVAVDVVAAGGNVGADGAGQHGVDELGGFRQSLVAGVAQVESCEGQR